MFVIKILFSLSFFTFLISGAKIKSWLGRNSFIGGMEPEGRYYAQMGEMYGYLYLFGGLHGSGLFDAMFFSDSMCLMLIL